MGSGLARGKREITRRLIDEGYQVVRQKGSHQHWKSPDTGKVVTVTGGHEKISGNVVRSIFRQAGWSWTAPPEVKAVKAVKPKHEPIEGMPLKPQTPPLLAVLPQAVSQDEMVAACIYAKDFGDEAAAAKYRVSARQIESWRLTCGDDVPTPKKRMGRLPSIDPQRIETALKLLESGRTYDEAAHTAGLSHSSVGRIAHGILPSMTPDQIRRAKALSPRRLAATPMDAAPKLVAQAAPPVVESSELETLRRENEALRRDCSDLLRLLQRHLPENAFGGRS